MEKKKYIPRVSDILGIALLISMVLLFCASVISSFLKSSALEIFLEILVQIPVFLVPILFVGFTYKRLEMEIPEIRRSLDYNQSAMLYVSTFGVIVLIQMLYVSVFPSAHSEAGVSETSSALEFFLLFLSSAVVPAILEEIFFRGVVLRALTAFRGLLAILISSVVFALMHFSLAGFPIAFFCGFLIGSAYYTTGSLGVAIGIHLCCNAVWFLEETVNVYLPEHAALFSQILFAACVLLLAFGLPFLKTTVRAILSDEDDETVLPSSHFWGLPIVLFLVFAVGIQIVFGTL